MSGRYRRPEKTLIYLYRRKLFRPECPLEYLLLQRSHSKAGHIWQTVVGAAKWGEELVETARREVYEETGLTRLRGITAIGYAFSFPFQLAPEQKSYYAPDVQYIHNIVFAAEVMGIQRITLSDEHIAHGWFSFEEAMEKIYWTQDREALARLHPMISGLYEENPSQPDGTLVI